MNPRAWAAARSHPNTSHVETAHPDVLDNLIVWRMNDPRYTDLTNHVKGLPMQRQWTIEARADYADPGKNEAINDAIRTFAIRLHATMALLADNGVVPQVVTFSDDFFDGHEEIKLHADKLEPSEVNQPMDKVSDELLQAARDMQHDKNNGT